MHPAVITQLHIQLRGSRHLGDVTVFLKKALRRHGLLDLAVLSRADRRAA